MNVLFYVLAINAFASAVVLENHSITIFNCTALLICFLNQKLK